MNRSAFVPSLAALLFAAGLSSIAYPATPTPRPRAIKTSHGQSLGRHINVQSGAKNRPVSAEACNSRAASMPGSTGTLGPNGASQSQTVVAVPIGGSDTATATRQQQINEACAHVRH